MVSKISNTLLPLSLVAFSLSSGAARAAPLYLPVNVSVVGTGRIKLLMAAGSALPCDSSSNATLAEGWVDTGSSLLLQSPYPCVCEQHTTGAFRETSFTPPRIFCQQIDPVTGVAPPFIAITVSSDE